MDSVSLSVLVAGTDTYTQVVAATNQSTKIHIKTKYIKCAER